MTTVYNQPLLAGIYGADTASIDAFSRLRVSTPTTLFESTFRYDLAPLQYESITSSGTVAHDATNSTVNLSIVNSGTQADETIAQAAWNLDKLDGTGDSGITLDLSKSQILVIDFQWLGVGRVRVGFDIDGTVIYAHEFLHANSVTDVYMQTATLPIRAELTTGASETAAMSFVCASVVSEGGQDDVQGYTFATEFTGTAGNGAQVHLGSLRPFTAFNSIAPRYPFVIQTIETIVTGNNPVLFEVIYGATFSAGPTWAGAAFST